MTLVSVEALLPLQLKAKCLSIISEALILRDAAENHVRNFDFRSLPLGDYAPAVISETFVLRDTPFEAFRALTRPNTHSHRDSLLKATAAKRKSATAPANPAIPYHRNLRVDAETVDAWMRQPCFRFDSPSRC